MEVQPFFLVARAKQKRRAAIACAASVLDGRTQHHWVALQATQFAAELAPDSIVLAQFHNMLLFDAACDSVATHAARCIDPNLHDFSDAFLKLSNAHLDPAVDALTPDATKELASPCARQVVEVLSLHVDLFWNIYIGLELLSHMSKGVNQYQPWPPPSEMMLMSFDVGLPPLPWPFFSMIEKLLSFGDWDAQQPWPPHLAFLVQEDRVSLRPTPWPSFYVVRQWLAAAATMVADKVVVAARAATRKISKTVIIWALTHVVQPGGSTILSVILAQSSRRKLWSFLLFAGDCASGHKLMVDQECALSELCSQLSKKLVVYDMDKINVRYKIDSDSPRGVAAAEFKQAQASWVMLDKDLKHGEKRCVEELQCSFGGVADHPIDDIVTVDCGELPEEISWCMETWESATTFRNESFMKQDYKTTLRKYRQFVRSLLSAVDKQPWPPPKEGYADPLYLKTSVSVVHIWSLWGAYKSMMAAQSKA